MAAKPLSSYWKSKWKPYSKASDDTETLTEKDFAEGFKKLLKPKSYKYYWDIVEPFGPPTTVESDKFGDHIDE